MRAVVKLCNPGAHRNIVAVLRYGKLPRSYFYFLDMELCDLNLEAYIQQKWTPNVRGKVPHLVVMDDLPEKDSLSQVADIMHDLVAGVAFIHSHKEIHRDLKPQNGMVLVLHITYLQYSIRAKTAHERSQTLV